MIRKETVEKAVELFNEHEEFSHNKEFNALLNDGELGEYQVLLKTPEGEDALCGWLTGSRPSPIVLAYEDTERRRTHSVSQGP